VGSITVGAASTHLSCSNANYLPTGTIAATYPKGFAAFWVMKYEISQQQYDDFLNSIDYANAVARNPGYFTGTHPALVAPQPERAASQLSQNDVYTFLDWSAMRPMSEFEYEKACRGSNQAPIPDEYPWGNTTITQIATPTDVGLSTEIWATGNGNYNNTLQPMRCGALATSTSNRAQSGATFYGIMEMGGNISEVVVNALGDGRTYTGQHGDGNISNIGSYDVVDWPGLASGLGYKGSSYNVGSPVYLRTSDRSEISVNISRANGYGGRGVRKGE
jgi:formylglycine-generating enzyme required for sulfatase activity